MVRFFLLCVLIGWGFAVPAIAQPVELTQDQAKQIAQVQLQEGNPEVTGSIALALLQINPNDYDALMLLASAEIALGHWGGASDAAKRAFRVADNNIKRVDAARLVASAHFRAEQYTRSEIWLRRAFNNAPAGPAQDAVRQDFAQVKQVNPLTVQLNFSAAPNSNINNGSSSEQILIWNLPFILSADARALSGIEVSGSIDLNYRLSQSANYATDIGLTLFGRLYKLSPEAARAAPNVSGSDYAFSLAEMSLTHIRNITGLSGPTTFDLTFGKNWYGGNPYTNYGRVTLGQKFQISDTTGIELTFGYEQQELQGSGVQSDIYTVAAGATHRLGNQDMLGFQLQHQQTSSDDVISENTALRALVNYRFAKPVWGTQVSLNLSAEQRDYDLSVYSTDGRHDLTLSAGASFVFLNVSYFGFSPSVSLESSQTNSNVDLFDRNSTAIRFGVQSAF